MKQDSKIQFKQGVTIKDIAKAAGVSVATVSHALNGYDDISVATKERILNIADKMYYIPSKSGRALRGIRSTIAFMLAGDMPKEDMNGFTFGIMSGIYTIAQKKGYDFEILTAPIKSQEKIPINRLCNNKKVAGLVVYGLATDMPYFKEIPDIDIPCILVDMNISGNNISHISVDHEKASFEIVEHLIEKGCKNIAMLSGRKVAQVSLLREEGYMRALDKYGLTFNKDWLVNCGFEKDIAKKAAVELKKIYPTIDAFFCASDIMAIGAIEGISELGFNVPKDVAVAGFDDYPITKYIYGGITTIKQYPYDTGVVCAESLISALEGKQVQEYIQMDYTLKERASTDFQR